MQIKCSKCGSTYQIDESKIPDKGAHARCKKCQNRIFIKKQAAKPDKKVNILPNQQPLNKPTTNPPETNTQVEIHQKQANIVCSKCGQRQPSSHDKCFKCGFNLKKLKVNQGGPPPIPSFNKNGSPIQKIKNNKVLIACLIVVALLLLPGLYFLFGKTHADLFTSEQYNQKYVTWLNKWFLIDYQKFGHHSVKWDAKIKNVLNKYAIYRLGLSEDQYCIELLDDIQEVMDLGCNDARITYLLGNMTYRVYGAKWAEIKLIKSLNLLEQSNYPDYYRLFAATRLKWTYEKLGYEDDEVYDLLNKKKMKYLARASVDDRFKNGNQRYYINTYFGTWTYSKLPRQFEKFMDEYEKLENVDPWIDLMVRGKYHDLLGWRARGSGYAKTVTQDGWRIFKDEMSNARDYYTRAHQIHPEFPEAATRMIRVRMASRGPTSEREWFDLAVNAQFDYMPAYSKYLWALRPRWGGSHKKMLKFGLACLNTERFDTDVPGIFLKSIRYISEDYDIRNWRKPFLKPGIYKNVQKYFEGILNEPGKESQYYRIKSSYVLYAWVCGKYKDAKEMMNELGENFIPEVSKELKIKPEEFVNHLSAM